MIKQNHQPTSFTRKDKIFYICDNCKKEIRDTEISKINNEKGQFAYCSECMKKLYPTYKKVKIYNPNSAINKLQYEANSRFEKNR